MPRLLQSSLLVLFFSCFISNILTAKDQSFLYSKVSEASFEVHVNGRLAGSGWFALEKGWGFTAFHVVGSRSKRIELKNGEQSWKAEVHAVNALYDVALLKVQGETPSGLEFAPTFPKVGKDVHLYGAPLYRHGVWLPGKVARPDLTYEWMADLRGAIHCYHVAGHAPKGVSGGPWVNGSGQVVGLQSGTMTLGSSQQGLAFVTPAEKINTLLETKKTVPVLSLGCAFEELSEQPGQYLAKVSPDQTGVVIKVVSGDGPLGKAGLKAGDVVVSINDKALKTRNEAYAAVQELDSKAFAKLVVLRPGEQAKIIEVKPATLSF